VDTGTGTGLPEKLMLTIRTAENTGVHPIVVIGVVITLALPLMFVRRLCLAENLANREYAVVAESIERKDPPPPTTP
jgi:hypothetical protein